MAGADERRAAEGDGALGILLARVQDRKNLDRLADAIDEDVIGMDDRLPRAGHATGAVDQRVIGQAFGGV